MAGESQLVTVTIDLFLNPEAPFDINMDLVDELAEDIQTLFEKHPDVINTPEIRFHFRKGPQAPADGGRPSVLPHESYKRVWTKHTEGDIEF